MAERILTPNELKLINNIGISQYYNDYIVPLSTDQRRFRPMKGDKPTGICPFHVDTDPSMHEWKGKNLFRCFGCGSVGNVIQMHQRIQKDYHGVVMDYDRAMITLAALYGIELEYSERGELEKPSAFEMAKKKLNGGNKSEDFVGDAQRMSLSQFRTYNNQIKKTNLDIKKKISNYNKLDIALSAQIMEGRK